MRPAPIKPTSTFLFIFNIDVSFGNVCTLPGHAA
jgi:hypothetical protein